MGIVNIQGIGDIEFPDEMSPKDIQTAIEKDILPQFPQVMAKGKRSWGEAATDVGAGLASGVGSLLQVPGQIGQLAGLYSPEEASTGLQGVGKSIEQFGEGLKSPVLKGQEAVRAQKVAQASAPEGIEGMWGGFKTAITETIKNPALLSNFFAEQVPNLVGSMGGGLVARGATKVLLRDATEAAIGRAGLGGAVGTGAVMQGADVGSDTYEAVYKRLEKENPDMSDEERNRLALGAGREAAINAAMVSLGTALLPGGTSVERALAGKGMPGTGGMLKGFLGEAGSEAIEEGGGKALSNLAQQRLFPDVSLTQGVGEAAGMGALGGGLFGGISGGINARNEAQRQAALEEIDRQKQLALDAEEAARAADEQARIAANDAANAAISHRGWVESGGATNTQAFADLSAEVEQLKAKAEASAAKAKAARDRVDAQKAKMSAFSQAYPDLLGDVVSQQPVAPTQQEAQQGAVPVLPGQLGFNFTDASGQLGLPEVGIAQPAANVPPVPEAPESLIVNQNLTKALGIAGGNKKVRNAIEGKDLTDPTQREEVRQALSAFAERTQKEGVAAKIEEFLNSPFFREQGELALANQEGQLGLPEIGISQPKKGTTEEVVSGTPTQEGQGEMFGPRGGVLNPVNRGKKKPVTAENVNAEPSGVPGQPPVEPTTDGQSNQPSMAVDRVGAGTAATQTGTAPRTKSTRSRGLDNTVAGTESNVGREQTPSPAIGRERAWQLDFLAGDLDLKEAGARAKYKKLSPEEKAYVDARRKEYKNIPKALRSIVVGTSTTGLTDAARKGSVTYALEEIATDKAFSPLAQLVAKRLLQNKRYSEPKIEIVPAGSLGVDEKTGRSVDGLYNPYTDTIQIVEGAVDSHTVLHEAVHGYVHALITEFEKGVITSPALKDLQDLYHYLLDNHPELKDEYGMESLTEFAAEAMSNPNFQAALYNIPYKKRNVFQEFARKVLEMLGLTGDKYNALAEALINVERAMNVGRGYQQDVSGTAKAPPVVNVARREELAALNRAGGGKDVSKSNPNPVGSALNENAKLNEKEAVRKITTTVDAFETGALSSDAALNNSIRRELAKDKKDWNFIKDALLKISTSQALHSDALAVGFLEHGSLKYDPSSYKFYAEDTNDSWKNMMRKMSEVAKNNGLSDIELRNYANTAFIAERTEGLKKSKPDFYSHLTDDQIKAGKQLFDKIDGLRDVQKMWNGIRKNAMDVAVDNGLYSREQADDLLQYMDFVPFYREEQLESGAGPRKYPNGFIDFAKNFKIRGSEQPVSDVFGNMALWTTYTVSRAVRNRTALNMYGMVKQVMPDQVEDIRQDEHVKKSDNVVSMWENGQRKRVKFADPLFVHAFEGMESVAIPLFKDLAKASNFLRQSIVLNPLFSLSQLSQDSFAAMLTSGLKNPLMIPIEVVRQFSSILLGTNATGKYLAKRGMVGSHDYMSAVHNNDLAIATGLKPKSTLQKLLTPFEKFSMASDNAVRQALYNRTLLETGGKRKADGTVVGGDEATALERGFEIINFKRSGANGAVSLAKQTIPFFGAYLQAMNVMAKVLTGRSISPTERSAAYRTLVWNSLMVTGLAFMYAALSSGDDDYEKMDPQVRDKHLLIPGTGFMLPLRNDFTLFPKLAAEYAYLTMTDNGFTDGKKVRKAMGEALSNAVLSPTVVPQFIKPAFEVGINHNFFTGRDLVGKGVAGRDTEAQYTASTSELGKMLGKLGVLSPIAIDHLIKGYAGSVGGLMLMATNAIMEDSGVPKAAKGERDSLRQIPGMGTFFASEYGNAMKNDFYDLREEVSKAVNTLNAYKKESPEKAREYMEEHKDVLKLQKQVNAINNQLTKLREYSNRIQALPTDRMDAEKKKAELDRVKQAEDRMLMNVYKLRNMAGY